MKKLLIFDLDGTLADTIYSIRHAVNLAMEHFGYPERSYEEVRLAIGDGARLLIKRSLPTEVSEDEELVSAVLAYFEKMYDVTYLEADKCYDGMSQTLARLRERGYEIAVLSNKQDTYVRMIVERIVEKGVVSLAMGQREGYPRKPDPTVPKSIADTLGYPYESTVFIGDSEVDVLTAKNAGMMSVGCSWGYRGRAVLEEYGADVIVDHPTQLLECL